VLSTLKKTLISFLLLSVAGCSTGLRIDRSHPSANQDNRIQFVVLHYTNASLERSLALLTQGEVSSHYLIGDGPATVYQLVDENRRAWHAGDSQWQGRTWLNSSSIGIEIVNPGFTDTPNGRVWHPYSEAQIQSLIALLKDIVKRNNIEPRHIIGHSDIAPLRKRLRSRDFIARFGGEEFVLLVPQTALGSGIELAETLRGAIEACPFHFKGERVTITLSIGITAFRSGERSDAVLKRADEALYRAKHLGRNRVEQG